MPQAQAQKPELSDPQRKLLDELGQVITTVIQAQEFYFAQRLLSVAQDMRARYSRSPFPFE